MIEELFNLWETNTGNPSDFPCKAKVYVENGPVGVTGDGKLTNYINVYRTKMINRKIGIFFVRGTIKDPYLSYLKLGNYIVVDSYDLKEWFIDLDELKKNVPEIIWHTSSDDIDTSNFSLDDLYFATV